MSQDFIPSSDAEFNVFLKQLADAIIADPGSFGLTQPDVDLLQNALKLWNVAYPAHLDGQKQALALTEAKDKARDTAEQASRSINKKINAHPAVDNAMRASAGLPARDTVKTKAAAPTTRPIGRLETMPNSTLVVHFVDETTPLRTAKPQGIHACEIRVYVGDSPPRDASGHAFLAHDTATPYMHVHATADAGKNAYYILRWLNTKLDPGPWSDVVSAKIPL